MIDVSPLRLDASTGKLFWVSPPKNHAEKAGLEAGYLCLGGRRAKPYWQVRIGGGTYKRSRLVFFMVHGRWPRPCVDHINGDSLDDRPENLREATLAQNAWNSAPRAGKQSGLPRGVSVYRAAYRAVIGKNGVRTVIGSFETPALASASYEAARKEMFGEYA